MAGQGLTRQRLMRPHRTPINIFCYDSRAAFDQSLPFGGFKQSGMGREGGREGLSSFTEFKSVLLDT